MLAALARSVTKSLEQGRECRGGLPAARLIKMIAGEGRAPVFLGTDQCASAALLRHIILGKQYPPESDPRPAYYQLRLVGRELHVDPHLRFGPRLFQLPVIEAAGSRQAKYYADVLRQILWRPRR